MKKVFLLLFSAAVLTGCVAPQPVYVVEPAPTPTPVRNYQPRYTGDFDGGAVEKSRDPSATLH